MTLATAERVGDILRIQGELNFDSVAELWTTTRTSLQAEPFLRIDLSGVRHADSAGVALLVEWLRLVRSHRHELVFTNIPAQMQAIIRVVDLETTLPVA